MSISNLVAFRLVNNFGELLRKNTFAFMCRNVTNVTRQFLPTFKIVSTSHDRYISNYSFKSDEQKFDSATQALIHLKYLRLIKVAIRENGPILEENPKLASLMERAKERKVPHDFIEYVTNISIDTRANAGLHEMMFPNGCHFIVQYEDIDSSSTSHHLLQICNRSEATFVYGDTKCHQTFHQKGIILLNCQSGFDDKNIEETVRRCGAETAKKELDEEGCEYWKFYCNSSALHQVKKSLQNISPIEEAYIGYIPKRTIASTTSLKNTVSDIIIEITKVPQIDRIYVNIS